MILHADAVAENRAAGVGTGRIDGDDADGAVLLAIVLGELIDQGALPCSRRAGETDDACFARMREEGFQQVGPARGTVLDRRDSAGKSPDIARTHDGGQIVELGIGGGGQANSVKQSGGKRERALWFNEYATRPDVQNVPG